MKRRQNKRGIVFLIIGILMVFAAIVWYSLNIHEDKRAGQRATELLEKINEQPDSILTEKETDETPVIMVEGEAFCGKIVIEKLDIELPVFQDWSYEKLKEAPCRYIGSIDTGGMIIAAHNYQSHFGNLKLLQPEDVVIFIDATGEEHRFSVKEITILDGTDVTNMNSGEWDFTLFTCTKGGKQRVTVLCNVLKK